jgi:hypothetical protein
MAVDHIKTTAITSLDAGTAVTAGEGTHAVLKEVGGFMTATASSSVNSTYQFARVPSNCKVKSMIFESEAQSAAAIDIGVYRASDGQGGQPTTLLAAAAVNQTLFATAVSCATAVTRTDVVNESGSYTLDKRNQPLWQAAGLTSDPGGFFDIVGTVTTAVTTGTGKWGLSVGFTE